MELSKLIKILVTLCCLSLVIALLGLVIANGSKAEASDIWRPLSEQVSADRLADIVAESTAPSANRAAIQVSALGHEQGDLLLVDFNTPELCGLGGCALAGYSVSTGERVLAIYTPRTAPDDPLVGVVDVAGFDLPCLLVPAVQRTLYADEKEQLCFQGGTWGVAE